MRNERISYIYNTSNPDVCMLYLFIVSKQCHPKLGIVYPDHNWNGQSCAEGLQGKVYPWRRTANFLIRNMCGRQWFPRKILPPGECDWDGLSLVFGVSHNTRGPWLMGSGLLGNTVVSTNLPCFAPFANAVSSRCDGQVKNKLISHGFKRPARPHLSCWVLVLGT